MKSKLRFYNNYQSYIETKLFKLVVTKNKSNHTDFTYMMRIKKIIVC